MAVKVAISIFVNELNAKNLKSSKTQFQFQFELSLAQFSPSLFQPSSKFWWGVLVVIVVVTGLKQSQLLV